MFQFNFSVDTQNEDGDAASGCDPAEPSLDWLPAQRHEIRPFHQQYSPDGAIETTVRETKLKYVPVSSVVKNLREDKSTSNISSILDKQSDLVPAVYEGGLTIWECTWDLLLYLAEMGTSFENKRVLELGCGAALPAIFCALHGAHITLQDYNEEVVNYVTIPNVFLNLADTVFTEDKTVDTRPADLISSRVKFYSGDWAAVDASLRNQIEDNMSSDNIKEEQKFDIILSSETIYNPACYKKLLDLMTTHLKQDGVILLAAKTYYFGVGGGTQQFSDLVKNQGYLDVQSITSNNSGVRREILRMKLKKTIKS